VARTIEVRTRPPALPGAREVRLQPRTGSGPGPAAPAILAIVAAFVAVAGSLWLFPLLTENHDEGAYLAQAESLQAGHLFPVAPDAHGDSFRPWLAVERDGHYVYKYAPVHAGVLATGGVLLGSERAALGLIAAAAVMLCFAVCRELQLSRRTALLAALFLALSPLYVIQSMTFLPYVTSLALSLAFMYLFLRGVRLKSIGLVAASGFVLGVAFFARPFDAILFAFPVLVWVLIRIKFRNDLGTAARTLGWLAVGALPVLLSFFTYNWIAAGDPFDLPFQLLDSSDTLGFGYRRVLGLAPYLDFTVARAWDAAVRNVLLVVMWGFGSAVLVILALCGLFTRLEIQVRALLLAMFFVWPVGLFFFWGSYGYTFGWDGGRFLGPWYYLPALVPLVIAAAIGFDRLLSASRTLSVAAVIGACVLTVPVFTRTIDTNRARTARREVVHRAVTSAVRSDRALVFLPGVWGAFLQHPFPFLRNNGDYDGHIVYAVHAGQGDLEVANDFPGRQAFIMSLPNGFPPGDSGTPSVWVDKAAVHRGGVFDIRIRTPRALPQNGLVLRVGVGSDFADASIDDDPLRGDFMNVPVDNRGRAHVRLDATSTSLVLADPASGTTLQLALPSQPTLNMELVQSMPDGTSITVMQRRVALKKTASEAELLWPGQLTSTRLMPDLPVRWKASVLAP
jgi:4-amino-4-deoxy-L-arabinose transferase-like glycosyltransferase